MILEDDIIRKLQKGDQQIFKVVRKNSEADNDENILKEINKKNV